MGNKIYKINDILSLRLFDTKAEKDSYEQGFKDFCESVKSKLEGKGPHTFFETKEVKKDSFENDLIKHGRVIQQPQTVVSSNLWNKITQHTGKMFAKNGNATPADNAELKLGKKVMR